MCVCIYTYIHVYHVYTRIRTYTSVCTYIHTCQLIDKRRTHSHSHKSVGIPRVEVINPMCNDQIFANKPGRHHTDVFEKVVRATINHPVLQLLYNAMFSSFHARIRTRHPPRLVFHRLCPSHTGWPRPTNAAASTRLLGFSLASWHTRSVYPEFILHL